MFRFCTAHALAHFPFQPHPTNLQPLVREGRMDKFYFEPTREEMAGSLRPLFAPELDAAGVEALLDAFPGQPMVRGLLVVRLLGVPQGSLLVCMRAQLQAACTLRWPMQTQR